uniref:ANK_REP_REGION domain-containing protein n=1 Tax=Macrostomum lignano TaxID=282301 RepID=A0A1I8JP20_9PLAT
PIHISLPQAERLGWLSQAGKLRLGQLPRRCGDSVGELIRAKEGAGQHSITPQPAVNRDSEDDLSTTSCQPAESKPTAGAVKNCFATLAAAAGHMQCTQSASSAWALIFFGRGSTKQHDSLIKNCFFYLSVTSSAPWRHQAATAALCHAQRPWIQPVFIHQTALPGSVKVKFERAISSLRAIRSRLAWVLAPLVLAPWCWCPVLAPCVLAPWCCAPGAGPCAGRPGAGAPGCWRPWLAPLVLAAPGLAGALVLASAPAGMLSQAGKLRLAAARGDVGQVGELIRAKVPVTPDQRSFSYATVTRLPCSCVAIRLEGRSAFHHAAACGHTQIVKMILDNQLSPVVRERIKQATVHSALPPERPGSHNQCAKGCCCGRGFESRLPNTTVTHRCHRLSLRHAGVSRILA